MSTSKKSKHEPIFYDSARNEIISRIRYRDSALIAYVASIGAYFAYVANAHFVEKTTEQVYEVLLLFPIPIACLLFTLIILQHHMVIGALGNFLSNELWNDQSGIIHWDNSKTLKRIANRSQKFRFFSQAIMLAGPLLYSVIFYKYTTALNPSALKLFQLVCILDGFVFIMIFALHINVHMMRKEFHIETWGQNKGKLQSPK